MMETATTMIVTVRVELVDASGVPVWSDEGRVQTATARHETPSAQTLVAGLTETLNPRPKASGGRGKQTEEKAT